MESRWDPLIRVHSCPFVVDHMETWLKKLGIGALNPGVFDGTWRGGGAVVESVSPIHGEVIARVREATEGDYNAAIHRAHESFLKWRVTPAPVRGETIRQFGNALRAAKADLGKLVTLETGKILAEGEGEVQEMIDVCDWKPSNKTPLCAIAMTRLAQQVCRDTAADPAVFTLLTGDAKTVGQRL